LVIHYDSANQNLANKPHSACIAYWKATRKFHTGSSRGWVDIGYSFMACPHGHVLEGRGLFRTQAAQPGGNSTYYSCTLATGPRDAITDEQINAVRELRQWLMEPVTSIAGTVKGHRDFIATSCPGDAAYAMVRNGTFTRPPSGTAAPAPDPEPEDFLNMADLTWLSSSITQKLPKGERVCILFDNGTEKKISKDDRYATLAFSNKKVLGDVRGQVVALDASGNLVPVAYKVELGKVKGAVGADAVPDPVFRGVVQTTTEFAVPVTEVTHDDERLRVYVTALVDGAEWRGGKATLYLADK
jgi:hypothetical protein